MPEQKIRIIFTPKANLALSAIIEKFNLEEPPAVFLQKSREKKPSNLVAIDWLTKEFVLQNKTESDLANSLQKALAVNQQTAGQIAHEVISKVVPLLEKASEQDLTDSNFQSQLAEKIYGKPKVAEEEKESVIHAPAFLNVEDNAKLLNQEREVKPMQSAQPENISQKKVGNIEESGPKQKNKIPQKPLTPQKKSSGPDKYRESVE
jgi:hypothetical protein